MLLSQGFGSGRDKVSRWAWVFLPSSLILSRGPPGQRTQSPFHISLAEYLSFPRTVTFVPLEAGGERDVLVIPFYLSTLTWCSLAQVPGELYKGAAAGAVATVLFQPGPPL